DDSLQRDRGAPGVTRHTLHRYRISPLAVRAPHARLDDPLVTPLALRPSLRRRRASPRHRDPPRHFLLGHAEPPLRRVGRHSVLRMDCVARILLTSHTVCGTYRKEP